MLALFVLWPESGLEESVCREGRCGGRAVDTGGGEEEAKWGDGRLRGLVCVTALRLGAMGSSSSSSLLEIVMIRRPFSSIMPRRWSSAAHALISLKLFFFRNEGTYSDDGSGTQS